MGRWPWIIWVGPARHRFLIRGKQGVQSQTRRCKAKAEREGFEDTTALGLKPEKWEPGTQEASRRRKRPGNGFSPGAARRNAALVVFGLTSAL